MTHPQFEKYGYEPEVDSKNHFSYLNKRYKHGLPYRIGAAPDGSGGWTVYIDWKPSDTGPEGGQRTYRQEGLADRWDAAYEIEAAMEEHAPGTVPDSSGEGTVDPEFDFGSGL